MLQIIQLTRLTDLPRAKMAGYSTLTPEQAAEKHKTSRGQAAEVVYVYHNQLFIPIKEQVSPQQLPLA